MKGLPLSRVTSYLDAELNLAAFPEDSSPNGLQIEGAPRIRKAGVAVDACEAVFRSAIGQRIDFLFVHHGLIWGSLKAVTGVMKKRIAVLLEHGISLYACHLPLDGHPRLGNNARLMRMLSIRKKGAFGSYHGSTIGFWGEMQRPVPFETFCRAVDRKLHTASVAVGSSPTVKRVGIISGGGWFGINEAERFGIDTFLTGEPSHSAYHLARETGVNLIFAGHYATETPGVLAVGSLLRKKFAIETVFIDHPTGL